MGTFTVPGIPLLEALLEKVGEPHGGRTTYFVRDIYLMPPTLTLVPVSNCDGCDALVGWEIKFVWEGNSRLRNSRKPRRHCLPLLKVIGPSNAPNRK